MVESVAVPFARTPSIAVLFAPGAVRIIDIFRALGDFEDHYDVAALDRLEAAGFRLAVCTNKYENFSVAVLEGLGVAHR